MKMNKVRAQRKHPIQFTLFVFVKANKQKCTKTYFCRTSFRNISCPVVVVVLVPYEYEYRHMAQTAVSFIKNDIMCKQV